MVQSRLSSRSTVFSRFKEAFSLSKVSVCLLLPREKLKDQGMNERLERVFELEGHSSSIVFELWDFHSLFGYKGKYFS